MLHFIAPGAVDPVPRLAEPDLVPIPGGKYRRQRDVNARAWMPIVVFGDDWHAIHGKDRQPCTSRGGNMSRAPASNVSHSMCKPSATQLTERWLAGSLAGGLLRLPPSGTGGTVMLWMCLLVPFLVCGIFGTSARPRAQEDRQEEQEETRTSFWVALASLVQRRGNTREWGVRACVCLCSFWPVLDFISN